MEHTAGRISDNFIAIVNLDPIASPIKCISEEEINAASTISHNKMFLQAISDSSQSNTTNSCSSTNSLHFTEEEEDFDMKTPNNPSLDSNNNCDNKTNLKQSKSVNSINLIAENKSFSNNFNKIGASSVSTTNESSLSLPRSNQTSSNKSNSSSASTTSTSSSSSTGGVVAQKQSNHQNQNNKYIFILNAFVNGFAQLKLCADKIDYEYIIEVYWSNEDRSYVKRTYDDFAIFHRNLLQAFSEFFNDLNAKNKKLNSNSNINSPNTIANNGNARLPFLNSLDNFLMPVLPPNKKPFWISHLKLAESREIELNTYVQRILKLPTKISHSALVLKFFESQSSDPKPAKFGMRNNSAANETSEHGSDSVEDDRDFDDVDDSDGDLHESNNNLSKTNHAESELNTFGEDEEEDEDLANVVGDDDDDEDEYDEYNSVQNYLNNSTKKQNNCLTGNSYGLTRSSRKRINREAGLWWDEDNALNELTSSTSFDFGSQYHMQNSMNISQPNNTNNFYCNEDNDELETLKTLESILKNSELFRNDSNTNSKENIISSSSTTLITTSKTENLIKRLSLS